MSSSTSNEYSLPTTTSPLNVPASANRWFIPLFALVVIGGLFYVFHSLALDLESARAVPWLMLGLALLIALGFEFVNGFHDTANAVATVIYTRSLPAQAAVLWSGVFNFLGVLASSGAVAYGIVALLPVELIMEVGSSAGLAMVFSLLLAAIIWNIGTWYFGLPNSSSHTLIGSIMGVGLANQFLAPAGAAASGVDWSQAYKIGLALLVSPLIGFIGAAVLLVLMKTVIRSKDLMKSPEGNKPPPTMIRGLLILTCTGVSFAHGSNDGQKGMGLIMLILIGLVPTAFALNRTPGPDYMEAFQSASSQFEQTLNRYAGSAAPADDVREEVVHAIETHQWTPATTASLAQFVGNTRSEIEHFDSLSQVPNGLVTNLRNDIYLSGQAAALMPEQSGLSINDSDRQVLKNFEGQVNTATQFIPDWVKVAVALALGLGTMVGWKRIVRTVGERIGKTHMTYGQGASAELITMATIGAADHLGLPASTTHVLSSGVAGSMTANGSGLQWSTIRNMIMAWVLTLPASIAIAFVLYVAMRAVL
ncbi:inorganic phosphate transporter [Carnimonas bestiolae]|uniref:inorganic phosphate transporter n=1 Tax=Carnimonas bestiolae TaxID=3402172 RepID=UPI003EDBB18D